ncbi:MAG TPA: trypsin-like peptidase domain-containing protein, partial [Armatimonadota bacterium]
MSLYISLVIMFAAASSTPVFAGRSDDMDGVQREVMSAVAAVAPELVRIHVVSIDDRDGREVKDEAFGSGVIVSEDGYVITNHHVAGHAKLITCTMPDRTEIDARLVGTDALTDIAVIQLLPAEKRKFPVARFGDSSDLRVGDRVLAMGCPLALSQSVTMGIVSNTEMIAPPIIGGGLNLDGEDVGALVRWIGHDAQIHPGNSGGPLVNLKGEIVGINEIEMGLGGAIPGNLVNQISKELIKSGKIKRCWIGFIIQPLLKSSKQKSGVLIGGTIAGSPAEKAGLKSGDILVRLAGKDVSVRYAEERPIFNQYVMSLSIDKEVDAVIIRDGKELTLKITPTLRPDAMARAEEVKEWGVTASDITLLAARAAKRGGTAGVVVTSVRPGGPAGDAKPEIEAGDVIVEVGDKPVGSLADFRKITSDLTAEKTEPSPALVTFERGDKQFLTVVNVGVKELKDPGLEIAKAWLPVNTQVLTADIAKALGLEDRTGVRIIQVYKNSAAEKAGLKVGDIITALDGMEVNATQPEDTEVFPAMIRQYKIGSKVEISVVRDGKDMTVAAELPQSPKLAREMRKYQNDDFDFTVRDIAFMDRVNEKWS